MNLRAVDLCCGAGGWAAAARGLPIDWVCVADLAADCLETWEVNHAAEHPTCERLRCDLRLAESADAVLKAADGSVDLVVGGIPCEQVSVARGANRANATEIEDWHRLIDQCLSIVDRLAPRFWAIEDVIQIEKHLPGPLFHGKNIPCRRIEAADHSPQRRLRTFLGTFPDPVPEPGPRTLQEVLRPGPHLIISGAEHYEPAWAFSGALTLGKTIIRLLPPEKPCPTVTTKIGIRGGRDKRAYTVVDDRGRRRKLSWQEAATVQGFPDDYLFVGGLTRAAEMIGRAIPIAVGRAILKAICAAKGVE